MKLWLPILILAAAALVGSAAYLGMQSADTAGDIPPTPVTVPVTRGDVRQTVTAPGLLVDTKEALLGFDMSGRVAEISVRPGQNVRAGQVVARLNPQPLEDKLAEAQLTLAQAKTQLSRDLAQAQLDLKIAEAELAQEKAKLPAISAAEAALTAAQAELEALQAGPDEDEVAIAAADLRQAENDLKQAQWAYDQVSYRGDIAMLPEAAELEDATLTYESRLASYRLAVKEAGPAEIANAQAKVRQAQNDYDQALAEQGTQGQQITILEARLEQTRLTIAALEAGVDPTLTRAVAQAKADLAAATLTAPFDGVVLDIQVKPGEMVMDGAGALLLADTSQLEVAIKVIEEDLTLVQVGQPAEVFFDAAPDEAVLGRVARIVPQRLSGEDRPLYTVYLSLDRSPPQLVAGMTADAAIIIAEQPNVLRLPRALVQAGSDDQAIVEIWSGREMVRREVMVGLRGDVYIEIVAGLDEGMAVVGQ
ncbi:MAG: efflux RND transporter periplasmic adaptor subunit [Anaerolineaceae bacterium]|nr:efflux RND transporter periplasmic adaptor subunit [Anaerolineaceae bacterium]